MLGEFCVDWALPVVVDWSFGAGALLRPCTTPKGTTEVVSVVRRAGCEVPMLSSRTKIELLPTRQPAASPGNRPAPIGSILLASSHLKGSWRWWAWTLVGPGTAWTRYSCVKQKAETISFLPMCPAKNTMPCHLEATACASADWVPSRPVESVVPASA